MLHSFELISKRESAMCFKKKRNLTINENKLNHVKKIKIELICMYKKKKVIDRYSIIEMIRN